MGSSACAARVSALPSQNWEAPQARLNRVGTLRHSVHKDSAPAANAGAVLREPELGQLVERRQGPGAVARVSQIRRVFPPLLQAVAFQRPILLDHAPAQPPEGGRRRQRDRQEQDKKLAGRLEPPVHPLRL